MKHTTTVRARISNELYQLLMEEALEQNRTVSNMIATILKEHYDL